MNMILALILSGAFAIPGLWLLSKLGARLFKESVHALSVGIFLFVLGIGLALVSTIFTNVSQSGWYGVTSLLGKMSDAVFR